MRKPYQLVDENDNIVRNAALSIDNGAHFISPADALKKINMDTIVAYMDDEIRERVHAELAPCTDWEFLTRYLELAPDDLIIG